MTSQPSAMAPAVCLHAPYDIRGHWVNLADLDPDEHTEKIVDYEYFPHDYINCPPSSPRSRRGRTSEGFCCVYCVKFAYFQVGKRGISTRRDLSKSRFRQGFRAVW